MFYKLSNLLSYDTIKILSGDPIYLVIYISSDLYFKKKYLSQALFYTVSIPVYIFEGTVNAL